MFSDWSRLLPISVLFSSLKSLQQFFFPFVIAAVGGSRNWGAFDSVDLFGGLMLLTILAGVVKYFSFRFRIIDGELHVKQGILHRTNRKIPLTRIQNVRLYQGVLHRMADVVDLQVETAGAQGKAEAELAVVSAEMASQLREQLIGKKDSLQQVENTDNKLLHLNAGELIRLGIIQNRGLIVVGIVFSFFAQMAENFQSTLVGKMIDSHLPEVDLSVTDMSWLTLGLWVIGGLASFMLFLWALSIILSFIRYHNFNLSQEDQDLRLRYGLLARVDGQIPIRRIQSVSIHSTPLHRLFGRLSVKVRTAADNAMQSQKHIKMNWLIPIATPAKALSVLDTILPEIKWQPERWHSLHPMAPIRLMIKSVIVIGVLIVPAVMFLGSSAWIALFLLLLAAKNAWGYCKNTAWAMGPDGVHLNEGWIFRDHSQVPYSKIQSIKLQRGPIDRLFGMASISIDAAGNNPFSHDLTLDFLGESAAHEMQELIVERMQHTQFTW